MRPNLSFRYLYKCPYLFLYIANVLRQIPVNGKIYMFVVLLGFYFYKNTCAVWVGGMIEKKIEKEVKDAPEEYYNLICRLDYGFPGDILCMGRAVGIAQYSKR